MIGGVIFIGISLYVLLQAADIPNRANNGFTRNYLEHYSQPNEQQSISDRIVKISGVTDSEIYFSGGDPRWIMKYDYSLNLKDTVLFGIAYSERLRDPGIYVDSPDVYMYGMEISYLLKGSLDAFLLDTLKLETDLITRVAQISSDKLAIRGLDSTQARQVFKIMSAKSGKVIRQHDIFPEQQFGGFEKDGRMKYDSRTKCLYFAQMYQNGIYCMDTMLNLKYISRTIDTAIVNEVEIGMQDENGVTKIVPKKPRQIVNKDLDVFNGVVFILSGLKADNETYAEFSKICAIDMYNGENGRYIGSITIPTWKNKRLKEFKVYNNNLIALYEGGNCSIFKLNDRVLREIYF